MRDSLRRSPYAGDMRAATTLLLAALVAAGCSDAPTDDFVPPPATRASSTSVPASSIPPATTSTTPAFDACPEGDVMLADGRLLRFERPTSDGTRIAGISWRTEGECHQVSLSFATEDGAPATTPPTITARLLREAGVLRIETEATTSVIVDQLVEEGLVERLFVPIDQNGFRFVDLVLSGPVVARAKVLTSPARLELEMQSGGPEEIGSPLMTSGLVVVEPGSAAAVEPILDITGYSTGELESLQITVLNGDTTVAESVLELEPSPGVWLAFHQIVPMGDSPYDSLRLTNTEGSVIAGIPFNP